MEQLVDTYCEEYYANVHNMTPKFTEELDAILPYLEGCRSALDMGCGTGRTLPIYESLGMCAVGIDTSLAAHHIADVHGRVVIDQNACCTWMPSKSFDAVVSLHLLEHLKEPQEALKESVRLSSKVAVHLIPLGFRVDPTHEHNFETIPELLVQKFGRRAEWFEACREDSKRFGVIVLRA